MRFASALALAGLILAPLALFAGPAAAQQLGAPLDPRPAAPQKAAKPAAKPGQKAAAKAKPQSAAQAAGRQPKWEDAPLPAPLPERDKNPTWPPSSGGVRPTVGSGGGGMAIGF